MAKIRVSVGTTYVGCPSETIEFEYYGTEEEFDNDHELSTEILNMLSCGEFGHYFLNYDFVEEDDLEDEDNW